MQTTSNGYALIEHNEGLCLTVKPDTGGKLKIMLTETMKQTIEFERRFGIKFTRFLDCVADAKVNVFPTDENLGTIAT